MLHRGDEHILDVSNCNIAKFSQVIMVCYTEVMIIFLMTVIVTLHDLRRLLWYVTQR